MSAKIRKTVGSQQLAVSSQRQLLDCRLLTANRQLIHNRRNLFSNLCKSVKSAANFTT